MLLEIAIGTPKLCASGMITITHLSWRHLTNKEEATVCIFHKTLCMGEWLWGSGIDFFQENDQGMKK